MGRRVRAYVGLGSNVGDRAATLARAVAALTALPGARLRGVSWLYQTTPVGVRDQPDFANAVVALDVPAGPDPETGALALLGQLKAIEAELGRTTGRRWGPRVVDLDLLVFGRARVMVERPPALVGGDGAPAGAGTESSTASQSTPGEPPAPELLRVPHRDVAERLFVLEPLAELVPRLVPPGWHETVESARRRLADIEGPAAARRMAAWRQDERRWR